jgi:tetratricopeptide (TPR) repeat protein
VKEIAIPSGADEHDFRASLSADGKELVAYSPIKLQPEAMPKIYEPPPAPEQIKTNEELYLTGLRIDAFHNPQLEPEPYWEEALKRDPGDARVNTALAINYIKRARYADAEKLLRAAVERITANYTMPKDGEAFYFLGLALKAQGRSDDAFDNFSKSTWSGAWRSPGYFEMSEIALARGDAPNALSNLDRAIAADSNNIRALTLKGVLLAQAGQTAKASALAAAAARVDPLDADVIDLQYMADQSDSNRQRMIDTLVQHPQLRLEIAAECLSAGQWREGVTFLSAYVEAAPDKSRISPLVYYYLGYFAQKSNQPQEAGRYYELASRASSDQVFPFQREMIDVLEAAIKANPSDARAPYYLGNLLYDWQPERAVELWEKSVALGADFPVVYRNLATVYTRNNAKDKALAMLEKAVQFRGNAKVFNDLDQLYQENSVAPDKRLAMIEQHQAVIDRDDVIAREIDLKIFAGKYDDAINLLNARFFHRWEGGGAFNVGDSWANAMIGRGRQRLAAKQSREALADFQSATTLPQNLIEANNGGPARAAEINYWIGMAYEGMGDLEKAKDAWNKSVSPVAAEATGGRGFGRGGRGGFGRGGGGPRAFVAEAMPYFEALSLIKLGQADKAKALFDQLAGSAAQTADAHYLAGLGQLGLNDKDKARQEFMAALQSSPDHLGAKEALSQLR